MAQVQHTEIGTLVRFDASTPYGELTPYDTGGLLILRHGDSLRYQSVPAQSLFAALAVNRDYDEGVFYPLSDTESAVHLTSLWYGRPVPESVREQSLRLYSILKAWGFPVPELPQFDAEIQVHETDIGPVVTFRLHPDIALLFEELAPYDVGCLGVFIGDNITVYPPIPPAQLEARLNFYRNYDKGILIPLPPDKRNEEFGLQVSYALLRMPAPSDAVEYAERVRSALTRIGLWHGSGVQGRF